MVAQPQKNRVSNLKLHSETAAAIVRGEKPFFSEIAHPSILDEFELKLGKSLFHLSFEADDGPSMLIERILEARMQYNLNPQTASCKLYWDTKTIRTRVLKDRLRTPRSLSDIDSESASAKIDRLTEPVDSEFELVEASIDHLIDHVAELVSMWKENPSQERISYIRARICDDSIRKDIYRILMNLALKIPDQQIQLNVKNHIGSRHVDSVFALNVLGMLTKHGDKKHLAALAGVDYKLFRKRISRERKDLRKCFCNSTLFRRTMKSNR